MRLRSGLRFRPGTFHESRRPAKQISRGVQPSAPSHGDATGSTRAPWVRRGAPARCAVEHWRRFEKIACGLRDTSSRSAVSSPCGQSPPGSDFLESWRLPAPAAVRSERRHVPPLPAAMHALMPLGSSSSVAKCGQAHVTGPPLMLGPQSALMFSTSWSTISIEEGWSQQRGNDSGVSKSTKPLEILRDA